MNKWIYIFPCLLLAFQSSAQEEHPFYQTSIEFSDTTLLFDTLIVGDTAQLEFRITNTGKKDLIIRQVWPSCGCSIASLEKDTLSSGQETKLKVQFDSHGKSGNIENTFELFSNASGGYHVLRLKGFVRSKEE